MTSRTTILTLLLTLCMQGEASANEPQGHYPFSLGSTRQDYGKALAVDGDDHVLVAALFNLTIDAAPGPAVSNLTSVGGTDIVIGKYDRYGGLLWADRMGGGGTPPSIDAPHAIATDASNNVYVAGYFGSAAGNNRASDFDPGPAACLLTTISGYDAFLTKLDSNGRFLWALRLGNTNLDFSEERAWDLAVDRNGYATVVGAFSGTVDFNPRFSNPHWVTNPGTGNGLFAARYTPDGSNVWASGLGANLANVFTEGYATVALDRGGRCWLAGNFRNTCDLDPGPGVSNLVSHGNTDIFLARYGTDGALEGVWQMGGTGQDIVSPGAMRSDGEGVYLTGRFTGTADFDPGADTRNLTAVGGNNIFLAAIASNGTLRWAFNLPTEGEVTGQGGHRVALDREANVTVAGWSGGRTDFNPDPAVTNWLVAHSTTAADAFIARYDRSGRFVWANGFGSATPGTNDSNIAAGLDLDSQGNAYLTGQFFGPEADVDPSTNVLALSSAGQNDVFVAKVAPDGRVSRGDALRITEVRPCDPDRVALAWYGIAGLDYRVQTTRDLAAPAWSNMANVTAGADGLLTSTNTIEDVPPIFLRVSGP